MTFTAGFLTEVATTLELNHHSNHSQENNSDLEQQTERKEPA